MEEALRAWLLGTEVGNRIDWGLRPQGDPLPAITLWTISDRDDVTHDGPSGLVETRVQVDCWARTAGAAKLLGRKVRSLLSGARADTGGIRFDVRLVSGRQSQEADAHGPIHRESFDFRVWHGLAA
jgi:hypothetical protein